MNILLQGMRPGNGTILSSLILTKNGSFTYFAKADCRFPESYDWTLLASSTILQINLLDQ